jgi:hypothetical protein
MGMNDRYRLKPSRFNPGWWVCTDTVNLLVCTFEEGKFNETQKFTDLEGNDVYQSMDGVMAHIRTMREMSDWLAVNHPNIIFE